MKICWPWSGEKPQELIKTQFAPRPDITLSELAEIVQRTLLANGTYFTKAQWPEVPWRLRRHFDQT